MVSSEVKPLSPLMGRSEVAEALGVTRETIARYERLGLLRPVIDAPHGKRWARADVEKIIAGVLK